MSASIYIWNIFLQVSRSDLELMAKAAEGTVIVAASEETREYGINDDVEEEGRDTDEIS